MTILKNSQKNFPSQNQIVSDKLVVKKNKYSTLSFRSLIKILREDTVCVHRICRGE
jgi:hypothetical protein